jgi:hypothetical protein
LVGAVQSLAAKAKIPCRAGWLIELRLPPRCAGT